MTGFLILPALADQGQARAAPVLPIADGISPGAGSDPFAQVFSARLTTSWDEGTQAETTPVLSGRDLPLADDTGAESLAAARTTEAGPFATFLSPLLSDVVRPEPATPPGEAPIDELIEKKIFPLPSGALPETGRPDGEERGTEAAGVQETAEERAPVAPTVAMTVSLPRDQAGQRGADMERMPRVSSDASPRRPAPHGDRSADSVSMQDAFATAGMTPDVSDRAAREISHSRAISASEASDTRMTSAAVDRLKEGPERRDVARIGPLRTYPGQGDQVASHIIVSVSEPENAVASPVQSKQQGQFIRMDHPSATVSTAVPLQPSAVSPVSFAVSTEGSGTDLVATTKEIASSSVARPVQGAGAASRMPDAGGVVTSDVGPAGDQDRNGLPQDPRSGLTREGAAPTMDLVQPPASPFGLATSATFSAFPLPASLREGPAESNGPTASSVENLPAEALPIPHAAVPRLRGETSPPERLVVLERPAPRHVPAGSDTDPAPGEESMPPEGAERHPLRDASATGAVEPPPRTMTSVPPERHPLREVPARSTPDPAWLGETMLTERPEWHPPGETLARSDGDPMLREGIVSLDRPNMLEPNTSREAPVGGEIDAAAGEMMAATGAPERKAEVSAIPIPQMRPDLPNRVAVQIAELARELPERPVEITLNPKELGRVRLSFHLSETGAIQVVVAAERPETLDLLRRNIDVLGSEFRQLGYQNSGFSFQNFGQGNRNDTPRRPSDRDSLQSGRIAETGGISDTVSVTPARLSLGTDSSMDLRL
ncbi:flagellar hook-length control protein FliK [Celeribacter indicus]|nr:flagellar hook-length control protein FliK [Celeribacter indicus]